MIPLTVVVGVGGMGSSIAVRVQKHLRQLARERDRAQSNSFEENEIERNTRIFAIDTRPDAAGLGTGNRYILAPQQVDRTIAKRLEPIEAGGDASFQQWWPQERQAIGPFIQGAGAIRIKGKYAFYEDGWDIAEQINDTISNLLTVRNQMPTNSPPVFVFLVGSLSGGTGSGIILPLALQLRQLVTNSNVIFVGGIPLGSIMRKGPPQAFANHIWGNCSAALRELEWWMTPKNRRPGEVRPFLQKGRDSIIGDAVPFDLCYLFTEKNRSTRQIGLEFDDYAKLIADSIALDVNSDAAAQSQGSLSNFILRLTMQPARPPLRPGDDPARIACKPVTFGSVGAASLEYPVESVARYLGLELLETVFEAYLQRNIAAGATAQGWAAAQSEPRLTPDALKEALRERHVDTRTSNLTDSAPTRGLPVEGVDRKQAFAEVNRAWQNFDQNILPRLATLIDLNSPLVDGRVETAVWQQVDRMLDRPSGDGFAHARRFVSDLRAVVSNWRADLVAALIAPLPENRQIDPVRWPSATRDHMISQKSARLNELKKSLEGPVVGAGAVRSAMERFNRGWWIPYTQAYEQVALQTAVVKRYDALMKTLDALQHAFDEIMAALTEARRQNQDDARTILGGGADRAMMLEERVLNDPALVRLVFGTQLAAEQMPGEDSQVAALARGMTVGVDAENCLKQVLHNEAGPRPPGSIPTDIKAETGDVVKGGAARATGQFRPYVGSLSIWEALKREAIYRYRNNLRDSALDLVAPSGIYLPDDELARRYIEQRVKHCLETAEPSWNLDVSRLDSTKFPVERDGLLWYSSDSMDGLPDAERKALVQTVGAVANQTGLRAHSDIGSRHRILAMQREAGAALFMLDPEERFNCYAGEQAYEDLNGTAYGDRRFVDVLPPDFELSSVQAIIDRNESAQQKPAPSESPSIGLRHVGENGQLAVPDTYFEFMEMLDAFVEKGNLSEVDRDKAIDRFGKIRERLDQGKMTQETYDREVRMYLTKLSQAQPVRA